MSSLDLAPTPDVQPDAPPIVPAEAAASDPDPQHAALDELDRIDLDTITAYDPAELDRLLEGFDVSGLLADAAATADGDSRPSIPAQGPAPVPWCIHSGDALRCMQELPSDTVAAVITDPPYSSGGAMRSDRMASTGAKYTQGGTLIYRADFAGDNRDQRSYGYWSALWLGEALRVTRPGGVCLLFTDWRQLPVTTDALQAGGWIWRGIVPWDKTESARPDKGRFRNQCEYVVWGSKGPLGVAPPQAPCLPGVVRSRVRRSDKHHIAGKPTDLMRALVRIVWQGGTILDPFCGSGTTGVAAIEAGHGFIGCEAVEAYAALARERCAAAAASQVAPAPPPAEPAAEPAGCV